MDPPQGLSTTTDASPSTKASPLMDKNGWDGKLRVSKHAEVQTPEAGSDADNTDEDILPVEKIEPDEGLVTAFEPT